MALTWKKNSEQIQNKNILQGLQNKSTMCTKWKTTAK